ncbi:hypothetical protein CEN44_08855 [Fischerella muscicola CCMEE 5323]|uniref:non-specific serine/threonine protein kinase n=1 Tax=Fischerella muscicola CCMEE 5323 TaxID=2019572 RepID=A0A2N6K4W3_FISMU|nr:hypothetical protein CEN44_08855 [Fischerella muscicola CCMEE 5323]
MSLCINPHCPNSQNPDNILFCQACGSELLLQRRFRVVNRLGGGGFGVTFEVKDIRSNAPKVLKVLTQSEPKAIELFQQEAEVLAQLNHPGIPEVEPDSYFVYFPRDSQQSLHCLVMEKIEGMDLYEYMKQRDFRPIDQKSAVQWLTEIVTILQQVHNQNFFHRDIKPSNIMLRANGELALIDFGTARAVTQTYWFAQAQGNVTGIISAGYTPPEQFSGQAVPQSDFFALGRTFVFLLTGKEPNNSAIYDAYTAQMRWRDYANNILPQFADLIDQMMAHSPDQRPGNTQLILRRLGEIDQILHPRQPRSTVPVSASPSVPPIQPVYTPQSTTPATAPVQNKSFGWGFWLKWLLTCIVGEGVNNSFYIWLAIPTPTPLGYGVSAAVSGIVTGTIQWLILRSHFSKAGWWVLATTVGLGVGYFLGGMVTTINAMTFNTIGYSIAGIMQWFILRKHFSKSGWWVLSAIFGGALVGITYSVTPFSSNLTIAFIYGAFCGTLYGALTATVLVWLFKPRVSKP